MSRLAGIEVIARRYIDDSRGSFLKIVHGTEPGLPDTMGEIYMVRGYPGQTRANHYHVAATEWFTLIGGRAMLHLVDTESAADRKIMLDAADPVTVKVPPLVAHSFVTVGDQDFVLIAYSDERYVPSDTIAFDFPG
jgi:dTDP-4-dehydrorhamnose 3,5-epimerase-like enzyme